MINSAAPGKKFRRFLCLLLALVFAISIAAVPAAAVSQYVKVSVSPSTVIHGNSFTVSINGISDHDYTISITGPGTAPQLLPGQVGVSGGGTAATVTTDVNGRRNVAFTTTRSTAKQEFKITVTNTQDTSDYDSGTVRVTEGTVSISATTTQQVTIPTATTTPPTTAPTTEVPTTQIVTATPTEEETQTAPGFTAPLVMLALAILGTAIIVKRR